MARRSANRWSCLTAAIFLELAGGSIYIVGLYLMEMEAVWFRTRRHEASALGESLVFACNLGNWLPFAGLFFDSRWGGPRNAILVACVLTCAGYCGLALSGEGADFWQLWLLWFLWGHGSGYFDNVAVTTSSFTFHRHRGAALGLVKSFYGLSGSLLTQVYEAGFSHLT